MSRTIRGLALLGILVLIVGCEWESTTDNSTWNDRWDWFSFNGTYRAAGALLVSDFTGSPQVNEWLTESDGGGEQMDVGNGTRTEFAGVLEGRPIKPGRLTVIVGANHYILDDDTNGQLAGTAGVTGTIDYTTGEWELVFAVPLAVGEAIRAYYTWGDEIGIYSFVVFHEGNTLTITDNNGAVYSGNLGSIRSSGGTAIGGAMDQDSGGLPSEDDVVTAQFTASGTSASGVEVQIAGTLHGTVYWYEPAGGEEAAPLVYLQDRTMTGTWIEPETGITGDINGVAP